MHCIHKYSGMQYPILALDTPAPNMQLIIHLYNITPSKQNIQSYYWGKHDFQSHCVEIMSTIHQIRTNELSTETLRIERLVIIWQNILCFYAD